MRTALSVILGLTAMLFAVVVAAGTVAAVEPHGALLVALGMS
jgi:hypothetical protein